jgi:hypothetical protein
LFWFAVVVDVVDDVDVVVDDAVVDVVIAVSCCVATLR